MENFKAIIFDMDGLMFNTERLWFKSCMECGKKYGISVTEDFLKKYGVGWHINDIRENFKKAFPDAFPTDELFNQYREEQEAYMMDFASHCVHGKNGDFPFIKPGLLELIEYLHKNNYKTAIATLSKRTKIPEFEKSKIDIYLAAAGLTENDFDVVLTGDGNFPGKPAPDIFVKACELLEVNPKEAMVLEDSPNGLKAAKAAGTYPVMIPDCIEPTEETRALATQIYSDLYDVIHFLSQN